MFTTRGKAGVAVIVRSVEIEIEPNLDPFGDRLTLGHYPDDLLVGQHFIDDRVALDQIPKLLQRFLPATLGHRTLFRRLSASRKRIEAQTRPGHLPSPGGGRR